MKRALCWVRRDLRLHDHFALSQALKTADETIVTFIFDENILDKLHNNIALYTHSGSAPAKKAAAGEFPVGISFGYAGVSQKKKGMPVDIIFPVEGSGWDVEANGLVQKDAIKAEAKEFLDWAISDEAMNILKDDYAILSVKMSTNIPEGYSKNPVEQLIKKNDLVWAAKNRDTILKEWQKRYDGKTEPKK